MDNKTTSDQNTESKRCVNIAGSTTKRSKSSISSATLTVTSCRRRQQEQLADQGGNPEHPVAKELEGAAI